MPSFWHVLVSCIGLGLSNLFSFKYFNGAKCLIYINLCTFHVKKNRARLQWYSCARYKAPGPLVYIYLKVVTCDNFAWYRYMVNILVFLLSPRVHYKIVMQVPFVFFRAIFIYIIHLTVQYFSWPSDCNKRWKLAASGICATSAYIRNSHPAAYGTQDWSTCFFWWTTEIKN